MGGPSSEHEFSLATGESVLKNLDTRLFEPVKIKMLRDGKVWMSGRFTKLEKAVRSVDVCFLATHGEFGSDGRLQALLEAYDVPYTGSGILASALAMNKARSRQIFSISGFKTPKTLIVREDQNFQAQLKFFINKLVRLPVVVKPCSRGSSVGVSIVHRRNRLKKAIEAAFKHDPEVLIEEFIKGREYICSVIERKTNGSIEAVALPLIEFVPGTGLETAPAGVGENLIKEIQETAVRAHHILGCKDYSRSDFIVKNDKVYILETNTVPKQLKAAGLSARNFLSQLCFRNIRQEEARTV